MSAEIIKQTNEPPEQSFRLVPSGTDLTTFQTQLVIAAAVCLVCCLALFWPIFKNDIYHLVNLVLMVACAVCVTQVAAAITGLYGNRLGGAAAVWAGLLFCAFPLHAETVAAITARGQLLGAVFYLTTVLFYVKFRTWRERPYLWLALGSCLLGVLSSTFDWTIPLVITAAEFILIPMPAGLTPTAIASLSSQRLMSVMLFWFLLFFTASIGMLAPNLVPMRSTPIDLSLPLAMLTSAQGLKPLLFPSGSDQLLKTCLAVAYGTLSLVLIGRLVTRTISARMVLFLLIWLFAGFAGMSHLLSTRPADVSFISSVPLALGLALCSLPTSGAIARKCAARLALISTVTLTILTVSWFYAAHNAVQAEVKTGHSGVG